MPDRRPARSPWPALTLALTLSCALLLATPASAQTKRDRDDDDGQVLRPAPIVVEPEAERLPSRKGDVEPDVQRFPPRKGEVDPREGRIPIPRKRPRPPAPGRGTLMVWAVVKEQRVVGHRYVLPRPDPPSPVILEQTQRLDRTRRALGFMRVAVLGEDGRELTHIFIDDPLTPLIEVPQGRKGLPEKPAQPAHWVRRRVPSRGFNVVVPHVKGACRIGFTRFGERGERLDAGEIDFRCRPGRAGRRARTGVLRVAADASDAEHETLVQNGPSEERMDLLIVAEGFREEDRASFDAEVQRLLDEMFAIPIYAEIQAGMNIHTAFLASNEAGAGERTTDADGNTTTEPNDTALEAFYNCSGIRRLLCITEDGKDVARDVAADAPGSYGAGSVDTVAVLVNDSEYGGSGGEFLIASINASSPEIFTHEFGHTVVNLADEYEDPATDAHEALALSKVNVSGPVDAPEDLEWFDLVDPATDIPTEVDSGTCSVDATCPVSTLPAGTAGMFEGAGYQACGAFRPTTHCHMRCYVHEFCPVCQREYRELLGVLVPEVDVYLRDNALDVGNTPSPRNQEHPPGSGQLVKAWHSVDLRVDTFPMGAPGTDGPHENPIAGESSNIYFTVHNRGSTAAQAATTVEIFAANATGGAPPFPGPDWSLVDEGQVLVAGLGGEATGFVPWEVPEDAASHTCLIAIASAAGDPAPPTGGGLQPWVRDNNNVTWKNLHVVRSPVIEGEISNFENEVVPIAFRVEAPGVPVGTRFELRHEESLAFQTLQTSAQQMSENQLDAVTWLFARESASQTHFQLRTDLPSGDRDKEFAAGFTLVVTPPGGTGVDEVFTITVEQHELDPETLVVGPSIGGNTYQVQLE